MLQYAAEPGSAYCSHGAYALRRRCSGPLQSILGKKLDPWLQSIKDVAIIHQGYLSKAHNAKEFLDQLAECNVRQQVLYVQQSEVVQQAKSCRFMAGYVILKQGSSGTSRFLHCLRFCEHCIDFFRNRVGRMVCVLKNEVQLLHPWLYNKLRISIIVVCSSFSATAYL